MIRTVVQELRDKGTTVFINSHLLMEVEQICDRVVIMSKGRIIREGTVKELTPSTGWVEFRLTPVPEDLDRLLGAFQMPWERTEEGFAIDCDRALQNEVIDRLRASSVAIDSIAQRKLTLEESFIDLVTEKAR